MNTTNTQTFPFTSRETYLRYRAEWKADYATLSEGIRILKREIAQSFKEGGYPGLKQNDLRTKQRAAFEMLEELKASKEEAQRQYLAERETQNAA